MDGHLIAISVYDRVSFTFSSFDERSCSIYFHIHEQLLINGCLKYSNMKQNIYEYSKMSLVAIDIDKRLLS